ncbi:MAG TPA: UPF0164 family protein [bacterium]|nr:UPF0164 family protein [bacterium]
MRPWQILAAAMLLAGPLGAAGTTGADILNARTSARAAALGEAYSALGGDVTGLDYQPACVAGLKSSSISFLHYSQVESVNIEDLAYAQPFDFGVLDGTVVYRGEPAINNTYATDAPVNAYDVVVGIGWAGRASNYLDFLPTSLQEADAGVSLKYVDSQLGAYNAWTVAADLGLRLPLGEGLVGSVSLLNLGPGMTFISVTDPLPATLLGGISRSFDPIFSNQFNVAVDMEYPFQSELRMHVGLEDWLGTSLALRSGYILDSQQSLSGFTLGLGVKLDQEGLLFALDYAMKPLYYNGFASYDDQQLFQMTLTF